MTEASKSAAGATPKSVPATAAQADKPAAKPAKPAKPPALEDQPFGTFIPGVFIPALAKEIQSYGGPAPELSFEQGPMPVIGTPCWMVVGELPEQRRFWLCFTAESLTAAKVVIVAEAGAEPSLVESFLIDERKITLPLLVSRMVQRLNGQKWLGAN